MIRKFIVMLALIFFVASTTAFAVKPGEVFRVTGVGCPPKNFDKNDSFSKTFARQAARMDALRSLYEEVGGVHIESHAYIDPDTHKTIKEFCKAYTGHDSKVFNLLTRHARQVGEAKFTPTNDGFKCEVTMELVVPADWKE